MFLSATLGWSQDKPDLTPRQKQINQEFQQCQKDIADLYQALKDRYKDSVFSRQIDQIQAQIEKLRAEYAQIDKSSKKASDGDKNDSANAPPNKK